MRNAFAILAPVPSNPRTDALRAAVQIAPEDLELRVMLAQALIADAPSEAITEYREVLRRDPEHRGALLGLAQAFVADNKAPAAVMALDDLLKREPIPAEALALKARLLADLGDAAGAASAYRRAIELDPSLADLSFARRLGDLTSAPTSDGPADPAHPPEQHPPGPAIDGEEPSTPEAVRVGADPNEPGERPVDVERPKISFADVGGMDAIKDDIRVKIIAPVQHAELYASYGKTAGGGILLFGPPGCGKTHLARATAGEMGRGFISVGISDVLDMWLGQSERNLRDIFEGARAHQPCVLFFDEVDALAASRTDLRHSAGRNVVNQFLSELDGIESSNEGVLILAATNAPWHLDPAFRRPGRFDRVIFVPPPDRPAREAILRILLRDKPATDVDVEQVAARLDLFSGADLKGLVDVAVEAKLSEAMRSGIPTPLRTKDLLDAAKSQVPTTKEWFATARNHVLYANQAGLYDAVRPWLKL
jgi:transitional endoplasmic reticulum ATPase